MYRHMEVVNRKKNGRALLLYAYFVKFKVSKEKRCGYFNSVLIGLK